MKKKIASLFLVTALAVSTVMPNVVSAGTNYTAISGGTTTFKKFLIVDAGTNVPNATFSYTVAAGTAISEDTSNNTVMQVLAGVDVSSVAVSDTVFTPTDTTYTSVQTGDVDVARAASSRGTGLTAATGVQFEDGEKYAVKTATVDFSGVSFDEPGIYRYIITETANADDEAAGIMHDNDVDRVLDVYVTDNSGSLVVSGYVLHTDVGNVSIGDDMGSNDNAVADKTDGFTNEYNTKDLAFKKEVTGNQASRDKYFKLTLRLSGLTEGDKFTVSLAADSDGKTNDGNADGTSGSNSATITANAEKTNATELTAGTGGTVEQDFYLQHGQSIVVRGLPVNAVYVLTENAEDYKSTASGVSDYTDATSGTIGTIDRDGDGIVKTSYLNTRNGIIPTGLVTAFGPWVLAGVVIAGGILALAMAHGRREEEEEAEE